MDPSAIDLLLICLASGDADEKKARLAQLSREDWRAVVAAAQQHQVAPLLYRSLKNLSVALPGDMLVELKQTYHATAVRNIQLYRQLWDIARTLAAVDIPVILLKGTHLAEQVYGNLALRSMRDIDLLVKETDLARADAEMLARGHKPRDQNRVVSDANHHFHYSPPKPGVPVEIHWTLAPADHRFRVDMEGLWTRARPATSGPSPARVLSVEDLLLHLCLHAAKDLYNTSSLRMLCDMREIVQYCGEQLDWAAIKSRAEQWGCAKATYLFLRLTRDLLNAAIPADWLDSLQPACFEASHLAQAREQVFSRRNWVEGGLLESPSIVRLWHAPKFADKMAVIRNRLLLSRETLSLTYAAPANSWRIYLYYLARARDVLVKFLPDLWRLVRGDSRTQVAAAHTAEVTALRDWLISG